MSQRLLKGTTLLIAAALPALAGLLGTWTRFDTGGGIGVFNEVTISFETSPQECGAIACMGPGQRARLFETMLWTVTDVGRTVSVASIADDPDFETATQTLTNGVDDFVAMRLETPDGSGQLTGEQESFVFGTHPDFAGFQIGAITLTLNSLSFESPAPGFPADTTAFSVGTTVSIYGSPIPVPPAVPEPSSLLLLIGGLFVCLVLRGFGRWAIGRRRSESKESCP